MEKERLIALLTDYKTGKTSLDEVLGTLTKMPFENLGFARVDHHRAIRTGFPEVIFCQGKTLDQIEAIFGTLLEHNDNLLLTRAGEEVFQRLAPLCAELRYHAAGRCLTLERKPPAKQGQVLVISAGTADIPVAEEAALTASLSGSRVETLYDVGIAGIHRLTAHMDMIRQARCIVVTAGMEGALPSVVGGLAPCPIVAVPTSIGYGTHLGGLAPLFTMLNTCVPNVTVVNIDNGFGAGYVATLINRGHPA